MNRTDCYMCRGIRFWRKACGELICAVCHPPPAPKCVTEWVEGKPTVIPEPFPVTAIFVGTGRYIRYPDLAYGDEEEEFIPWTKWVWYQLKRSNPAGLYVVPPTDDSS